jgi:hypothetical protein
VNEKNAEKIKKNPPAEKRPQENLSSKLSQSSLFFFPTGRLLSFYSPEKKKRKKKSHAHGVFFLRRRLVFKLLDISSIGFCWGREERIVETTRFGCQSLIRTRNDTRERKVSPPFLFFF